MIMNEHELTPVPNSAESRKRWPLKTIIEVIPIIMALSALFTFGVAKRVTDVRLLTPLNEVVAGLPLWATILLALVMTIGVVGIGWGIFIFSRAPVAPDGSDDE